MLPPQSWKICFCFFSSYLFERQRDRLEISYPTVHSPNAHHSRDFTLCLCVGRRDPKSLNQRSCLPECTRAGSWDGEQSQHTDLSPPGWGAAAPAGASAAVPNACPSEAVSVRPPVQRRCTVNVSSHDCQHVFVFENQVVPLQHPGID